MNHQMSGRIFLLTVLTGVLLFGGVYYAAYRIQQGSPVRAEWWIRNVYDVKEEISKPLTDRKIIILSGSNALFGIDASVIERATGLPVLNLATHAGLDLEFHLFKLKQHMNEGDVVVMPLEYTYYLRKAQSKWHNSQVLAWGGDYLRQLSLVESVEFFVQTPWCRVLDGVLSHGDRPKALPPERAVEEFRRLRAETTPAREEHSFKGYSFESMDWSGAINVDDEMTDNVHKKFVWDQFRRLAGGEPVSRRFVDTYRKIQALVNERHGRLILTWPVSLRQHWPDLSLHKNQMVIRDFKEKLSESAINIHCNPALYSFDQRFFFNTQYHLRRSGGVMRSENLGLCIAGVLSGSGAGEMGFDEALRRVTGQEADYPELEGGGADERLDHNPVHPAHAAIEAR